MNEIQETIISDLIQKINQQKDALLIERILTKTDAGLSFSLKDELHRKFPRLCNIVDNINFKEEWFWNDGSDEGLLLITFVTNPLILADNAFNYNVNINYK